MTVGMHAASKVRPDESGPAGDENTHKASRRNGSGILQVHRRKGRQLWVPSGTRADAMLLGVSGSRQLFTALLMWFNPANQAIRVRHRVGTRMRSGSGFSKGAPPPLDDSPVRRVTPSQNS